MKKPTNCAHPSIVQSGTSTTITIYCTVCGEVVRVEKVRKILPVLKTGMLVQDSA
jgi:hypothetical protein